MTMKTTLLEGRFLLFLIAPHLKKSYLCALYDTINSYESYKVTARTRYKISRRGYEGC